MANNLYLASATVNAQADDLAWMLDGGYLRMYSGAQTTTASLSSASWTVEGYLVFRSISPAASSSTAWLTGTFASQGALGTAGSGFGIAFGSNAAVSVDTTGTVSNASGCMFLVTTFSVTGATIVTEWTSMQSLN